jgi:uncharacterized protein
MSTGAITLDDITSADWSLMLDSSAALLGSSPQIVAAEGEPGAGIGNVVQGIADINQCIGIILATPKGSDPLRPTFACDLWQWIDAPITVARPHLVREIVQALTKWEPRIQVLSVVINLVGISQLTIAITWQLKVDIGGTGNQTLTLTVPTNLA